jgi:hypothetical protein
MAMTPRNRFCQCLAIVFLFCQPLANASARPPVAPSAESWSNLVRGVAGRLLCSEAFCNQSYSNLVARYPYDGRDRVQGYYSYLQMLEDLEKASHSYAMTNALAFYDPGPMPATNSIAFIRLPRDAFDIMADQEIAIGSPRHLLEDFDGVEKTRYVRVGEYGGDGLPRWGDPRFASLVPLDDAHTHLLGGVQSRIETNAAGTQTVSRVFGPFLTWHYTGQTAVTPSEEDGAATAPGVHFLSGVDRNLGVETVFGPTNGVEGFLPVLADANFVAADLDWLREEYGTDDLRLALAQWPVEEQLAGDSGLYYDFSVPGEAGAAWFLPGPTDTVYNVVISNCVPYFRAGIDKVEDMPARVLTTNDVAQVSNIVKALKYAVPTVTVGQDACFWPFIYTDTNGYYVANYRWAENTVTAFPAVTPGLSKPESIPDGTNTVSVADFAGEAYPHVYTYTNATETVFTIPGSGVGHETERYVSAYPSNDWSSPVYSTRTNYRAIYFNASFTLSGLEGGAWGYNEEDGTWWWDATGEHYKILDVRINGNCCGNWLAYPYGKHTAAFSSNVVLAFGARNVPAYRGRWRMWANTNAAQNNFIAGEELAAGQVAFGLDAPEFAPERVIANVSNLFWERCTSMITNNFPTNWSTNAGTWSCSGPSMLYVNIGDERQNVGFQLMSIVELPDPW